MTTFHRYLPAGLGQHRCGICGGGPGGEAHIAGLNQESTGTELVLCPSCKRNLPTDFTLRVAVQLSGQHYKRIQRICRDCAEDPEYGKALAKQAEQERTEAGKLESLMGQLERDEISQDEYDECIAELLN